MVVVVVVDTSFLMIPAEFGIDVFAESERTLQKHVDFVVLKSVLREIDTKMESASGDARFRVAGNLAKRCRPADVSPDVAGLPVDDQLLDYAVRMKGVLATNDRKLKERARERGVPVLLMRGKKRLTLEGTVD